MSQFSSSRFASGFWQRPWRPSTWILPCAGLLAADRLRWLPAAWTDATLLALAALLTHAFARRLMRARQSHRREVQVLVLPLSPALEPDTRWRLLLFFLFMLVLVLVPALFA